MTMNHGQTQYDDAVGGKVFMLDTAFEYRGERFDRFTLREPKVRDLRIFLKEVDRDAIFAMEKAISALASVDEKVIAEMGIKDFSTIKKWFEDFLKHMLPDSED